MRALFRLTLLSLLLATAQLRAASPPEAAPETVSVQFAEYGHPGAWLVQRSDTPAQLRHGAELAASRRPPASSFKVLLALVGLQTGALRSAEEVLPWDGTPYPDMPQWQQDMDLAQALSSSSEPYFGVLAERIGHAQLAEWVRKLDYGNRQIGPALRRVWHDGVLNVSAQEQLAFIDRLRRRDLPVDAAHIDSVRAAMLDPNSPAGYAIYGKTGTHLPAQAGNAGVGWWIGWVEGPQQSASFVLELSLDELDARPERLALGRRLLAVDGLLPAAELE